MRFLRYLAGAVMVLALMVFSANVVRALWYIPASDMEVAEPQAAPRGTEPLPVRLVIPTLGITAAIQHVGVNESGNMAVPSNYTDVAWYRYGVSPGGTGSAVIAGHVNNGFGLSGVFERLGELAVGDTIYVDREDGRVAFIVTSVRSYPYQAVPTDIVFNPSGSPRLNLITCEGKWLRADRTYDQRLVVFTRLASDNEVTP